MQGWKGLTPSSPLTTAGQSQHHCSLKGQLRISSRLDPSPTFSSAQFYFLTYLFLSTGIDPKNTLINFPLSLLPRKPNVWHYLTSKLYCLLKCRFWFSRSGVDLRFKISDKLPGGASVVNTQNIFWVSRILSIKSSNIHSQVLCLCVINLFIYYLFV